MNDRLAHKLQLITRARRSGDANEQELGYADDGVLMYIAADDTRMNDWYRDVIADPRVEVHIGQRHWRALAATVTDPTARERGLALLDIESDDAGEVPLVALQPV